MLDSKTIAKKLIQLRNGKSREKVAKDLNISCSSLAMYETGKRIPRDEIKLALARYYETTVESLFFTN